MHALFLKPAPIHQRLQSVGDALPKEESLPLVHRIRYATLLAVDSLHLIGTNGGNPNQSENVPVSLFSGLRAEWLKNPTQAHISVQRKETCIRS